MRSQASRDIISVIINIITNTHTHALIRVKAILIIIKTGFQCRKRKVCNKCTVSAQYNRVLIYTHTTHGQQLSARHSKHKPLDWKIST